MIICFFFLSVQFRLCEPFCFIIFLLYSLRLLSHFVRCVFSRMFVSSFASYFQLFAPLCTVYVSFFSGTTSFVAMVVRSFVVASMLHSTNAYYLFNFFYCISIFVLMWIQCTNCLTSSSNVCFCTCFLVSFSPYIRLIASNSLKLTVLFAFQTYIRSTTYL